MNFLKKLLESEDIKNGLNENTFEGLYKRLEEAVEMSNPGIDKLSLYNKTKKLYTETCEVLDLGCKKNKAMYLPLEKARNSIYNESKQLPNKT